MYRNLVLLITFFLVSNFVIAIENFSAESTHYIKRCDNYMICKDRKFIWFLVPKVGTRTILEIMRNNFDPELGEAGPDHWSKPEYDDYFFFAFVRNPWDRIVSAYTNKVLGRREEHFKKCYGRDFDYFVDFIDSHKDLSHADRHICPQLSLFPYKKMNFIGRFENFAEDLSQILRLIGINQVIIPKRNSSKHTHYTDYYNERTKEIIARRYAEEISLFNYVYGEK